MESRAGGQRASYPPIEDYAIVGDCHAVGLIDGRGSLEWCCMPRFDHALFMLMVVLPTLPGIHLYMASERQGPTASRVL